MYVYIFAGIRAFSLYIRLNAYMNMRSCLLMLVCSRLLVYASMPLRGACFSDCVFVCVCFNVNMAVCVLYQHEPPVPEALWRVRGLDQAESRRVDTCQPVSPSV